MTEYEKSYLHVCSMSLVEFLKLIRDADLKIPIAVARGEGRQVPGKEGRLEILEKHIERLEGQTGQSLLQ